MSKPDGVGRAAGLLRRIAQVLDLPVERLLTPAEDVDGGSDVEQAVELLRSFGLVRDAQARRRCLAFVRHAAGMPAEASADPVRGAA